MKKRTVIVNNVEFTRINQKDFLNIDTHKLQFFIISQSGIIDTRGNIYFFTTNGAFFMKKNEYSKNFIDKLLSIFGDWNLINLFFCDFLIVNPDIYDFFVHELCAKNIQDFWFEKAFEIYKTKIYKKHR